MGAVSTTGAMQVYQLMRVATAWGIGIVLAKSGLNTEQIGQFEYLLFLSTVMTFFWVNGLLQSMPAFAARADKSDQFFPTVFWIFTGLAFLVIGIMALTQSWSLPLLTGHSTIDYFSIFAVYLAFSLPAFPVELFYLIRAQPISLVFWGIISFVLHFALLFYPIYVYGDVKTGIMGITILAALRFFWAFWISHRGIKPVFDRTLAREFLVFSFPIMATSLLGNLVLMFDQWLVGWYYKDASIFAIYRYGARELPWALALATALGMAMTTEMSRNLPQGLALLKTKSTRLMHWVFPVAIVGIICTKPLFPILFNPDFSASAPLFTVYLLLSCSRVLLPNSIALAVGETHMLFQVGLAELVLKILLGLVFIHFFGLMGLVVSALICYFFEKIALAFLLWKRHKIAPSDWIELKIYGIYLVILVILFAIV